MLNTRVQRAFEYIFLRLVFGDTNSVPWAVHRAKHGANRYGPFSKVL